MADLNADEFTADADRFVDDLNNGMSIAVALEVANAVVHHPDVIAAGTAMLANGGSIDMKQLAADAGMSRASPYRYYPDKVKVEAEIVGAGIEGMVAATHGEHSVADKFGAAAEYLIDNPGEAAALIPFAAMVFVSVLGPTVERITGDGASAPIIVGIAVMAATLGRQPGDENLLRRYIAECAAVLR
jgi:AcrR family transcriptional regulator